MNCSKIIVVLAALLAQLPLFSEDGVSRDIKLPSRKYKEITIEVGLDRPFQALHISDSHIIRIDDRDFDRLEKRYKKRVNSKYCRYAEVPLMDAVNFVESHEDMLLIHTGDVIDMHSEAGLDFAAGIFRRVKNCMACNGNHEYINVNGKASLAEEDMSLLTPGIQTAFPNNILFDSRIYNGINFVVIDNCNNQIRPEAFNRMKEEVKKGLPIVILCHIPFYIPETIQKRLDQRGGAASGAAASVVGAPLEITENYKGNDEKETGPRYGQRSNETTLEFTEWLRKQDCVKAILCGHNHKRHEERFSPSCMQYTVPACYAGNANLITFK